MTSPPAKPGMVRDSDGWALRLVLAFLAFVVSCTLILRTQMVPLGDLFSRWYGIQQLLNHGRNPYGPEVSREIQVAYYGHFLQPGEAKDEQRFAYPIYVIVLLWPMAFMRYSTVDAIALPLLTAAGAAFLLACVRFVNWPTNKSDRVAAVLLGLSTTPMLRGLRFEQLSTLVALFLMLAFVALSKGRLVSAGILLALATIKPQIALLPVVWAVIWAFAKWRERKSLVITLAAAVALLLVIGQVLLPGWLFDFIAGLPDYGRYAGRDSLLTLLAGKWVGLAVTAPLVAIALWTMYAYREEEATSLGFQFATAFVFALAAIVMPAMAAGHNQILMFPAALLLLRDARPNSGLARFFAVVLAWTPIMAVATWLSGNPHFMNAAKTVVGSVVPLILMIFLVRYATKVTVASRLAGNLPAN